MIRDKDCDNVISDGYAMAVVDEAKALAGKAEALADLHNGWKFCKPVKAL